MALGLILSSFLKLPVEFRYPGSLERYTSSVIIIIGAEKTIEVKADKRRTAMETKLTRDTSATGVGRH